MYKVNTLNGQYLNLMFVVSVLTLYLPLSSLLSQKLDNLQRLTTTE